MVISKTPFRISFFGGGTDYPSWYLDHGGSVISAAIDKYCYISVRVLPPFFGTKFRVVYSKIEDANDVREINHPAVRAILRAKNITYGVEIHHDGDLPARSGTGSSSSFAVGLINCIRTMKGQGCSPKRLAADAIYSERTLMRETVGSQDQVAAAYGGLNVINFYKSYGKEFSVEPIKLDKSITDELFDRLFIVFTGISRTASDIAVAYSRVDKDKELILYRTMDLVRVAEDFLRSGDIDNFGLLLDRAWELKRSFSSNISNPLIDSIYKAAKANGALGGKVIGAGGGGFVLIFAKKGKRNDLIRMFSERFVCVPVGLSNEGSKIIYFDDEEDRKFRELEWITS